MSRLRIIGAVTFACAVEIALVAGIVVLWRACPIVGIILATLYLFAFKVPGGLTVELCEAMLPEASPPQEPVSSPLAHLVGSQAKTISVLNLGGTVKVGEERFEAKSTSSFIPVGALVRVVDADGMVLVVEQEHGGGSDNHTRPVS